MIFILEIQNQRYDKQKLEESDEGNKKRDFLLERKRLRVVGMSELVIHLISLIPPLGFQKTLEVRG